MKNRMLGVVVMAAAIISSSVYGRTRIVPSQYADIQSAINASVDGDTVLLEPGTYYENINYRGRNIVVGSRFILTGDRAYIASTVINGSAPTFPDTASCVIISSGEDSTAVLEGLTLTGGTGTAWRDMHIGGVYREAGGVLTEGSSPTIRNNRIVGNEAINTQGVTSAGGGAIRSDGGMPHILNNVIAHNRGRYGAGIVLNFTGAIIRNNLIFDNTGGQDFGGSGIWSYANGPFPKIVENNTIVRNASTLDGGGVLVWSTSMTLRNNIIRENTAPTGPQVQLRSGGTVTVSYSNVEGGWAGVGNIDQPALFADSSFYLLDGSPCIDAGDTSSLYNDPANPSQPDSALWPSKGTLRNDIGAYGGPGRMDLGYIVTGVDMDTEQVPEEFRLEQNYPNPFNPTTKIGYQLREVSQVTLKVYDILGREVATLVNTVKGPGKHIVEFNGSGLASGVYLVRLMQNNRSSVDIKMIMSK